MSLRMRQKQSSIVELSSEQVKAFMCCLPLGAYQYVVISKKNADGVDSLCLKVGCSNHALLALSDHQARQSNNPMMFPQMFESVNVFAAGDIHKIAGYCYLTDQSCGYHYGRLIRGYYLSHQKLLSVMSLSDYPFYYFSVACDCEDVMRTLSGYQLHLLIYQHHRVTLYRQLEKLAVMQDASLHKSLDRTLNSSLVLSIAKKVLSSRHVVSTLPSHNLFQEFWIGVNVDIKLPERPIKPLPSQAAFFRHARYYKAIDQSDQLTSCVSECLRM